MALIAEGESSSASSNSSRPWKYHVFLSFRGTDTRTNFTDRLYTALKQKWIVTFRDDEELERGGVIKEELFRAIEESLSAIVILSPNYASSTWCLDELQKILDCRRKLGHAVFPIFYGVDPSHVRHQKGSFAKAFKEHEKRFRQNKEKIQKWRDALKEVSNLAGWGCNKQHEAKFIEEVIEQVWTKLEPKLPTYNDGLIGIDSKVENLYSLLRLGSKDVRFIGIWGMGGIGKTTLAVEVFKKIKSHFDISCFLANIRVVTDDKGLGLVHLQKQFLSHFKIKNMTIETSHQGRDAMKNLLPSKKILLVLDDVSAECQLENLAPNKEWFGVGSRVIVTTRDMQLLMSHGISKNYEVKILNNNESLQLFCQRAFKRDQLELEESDLELSKSVIEYAGGLPLALKVLGSFLCGRPVSQWKEVADQIKLVQHKDVLKKTLEISYDGLDQAYKPLFLDIACFFKGWAKNEVVQILKICDRYPPIGIEVLTEKTLVTFDGYYLGMHDLLQEMGKNIAIQESLDDPGKRTRMWSLKDIDQVLRQNKGTELIQGMFLRLTEPYEAHWDPEAFSKMCNLKLLIILCDLQIPLGLKCLSSSLKVLEWKGYPLEDLPLGVQLDEIVYLKMHHSKVKQLWNGTQFFRKLKFIDLSYSEDLIQTPDVSGVPFLERLVFEGCTNLIKVHQSVGQHKNIAILNLKECINLEILPSKLQMNSLKDLILSGCSKIKKLPEFGENMERLSMVDLKDCKNLVCLPNTLGHLKSLKILNVSGCPKFSKLPNNMNKNEALEELDVSGTAIRDLQASNIHFENIRKLSFHGCKELASNLENIPLPWRWVWRFWRHPTPTGLRLPPLSRLSLLTGLNLSYCGLRDDSIPHDFGCLSSLRKLDLSGNNFVNPPAHCIANLSMLDNLLLYNCPSLQSLPVLPPLVKGILITDCEGSLDSQNLWKIFESPNDRVGDWFSPWFHIPGNEIPPWFESRNFFPLESPVQFFDTIISTIVDIPEYCRWSEWWGIAVCIELEPLATSPARDPFIGWACRAPSVEADSQFPCPQWSHWIPPLRIPNLFALYFNGKYEMVGHHLKDDGNKLQLIFLANKLRINKGGWRVICKEDVQVLHNAVGEVEIAHEKRSRDEFEGDDASSVAKPKLHPPQRRKLQ